MIVGLGIDLEETARIRESIEKFGHRFLDKIFTPAEIAFCRGKVNEAERFAARFAAKEAAFKALQGDWSLGLRWVDFEVSVLRNGAPELHLHGKAAEVAAAKGVRRQFVSFTHTKGMVSAVVVLEKD
ncbi:MAG: holo-[acyl-carrier-protein] synthase [Bryobacter sp.]